MEKLEHFRRILLFEFNRGRKQRRRPETFVPCMGTMPSERTKQDNDMRGWFDSELVSVSQWFNYRMPVRKTRDLRFKSQLKHKFSLNIYHVRSTDIQNYNILI